MNRTTKIAGLVIEWTVERTGERNLDGIMWAEGIISAKFRVENETRTLAWERGGTGEVVLNIGCWADGTMDDGAEWSCEHEAGRVLAAILTGDEKTYMDGPASGLAFHLTGLYPLGDFGNQICSDLLDAEVIA